MKLKKNVSKEKVIRVGAGCLDLLKLNKSKGIYYCVQEKGVIVIDNRKGHMKEYRYRNIEELIDEVKASE